MIDYSHYYTILCTALALPRPWLAFIQPTLPAGLAPEIVWRSRGAWAREARREKLAAECAALRQRYGAAIEPSVDRLDELNPSFDASALQEWLDNVK